MGPELADRLSAALHRPAITALRCRTDRPTTPFLAN